MQNRSKNKSESGIHRSRPNSRTQKSSASRRKAGQQSFSYETLEPKRLLAAAALNVPFPSVVDASFADTGAGQSIVQSQAGVQNADVASGTSLPVVAGIERTRFTEVPDSSQPHTTVGNYRQDFVDAINGRNVQWNYFWNAPDNWSPSHPGNMHTGTIGDTDNYRPLEHTGNSLRPTGELQPNEASAFLNLNRHGGHVGLHARTSTGNFHDRYAIAAFTVSEAGFYSINDSFISKQRNGGDSIEVIVHVGNEEVLSRKITAPGSQYRVDFDTNLGFLRNGETVYVAVGAVRNHGSDQFKWDFAIDKFESTVASSFTNQFDSGTSGQASGGQWQYLWNAPDNWVAGTSHGNRTSGEVGNVDSYRALISNGASWSPGGTVTDLTAKHLSIRNGGGHAGRHGTGAHLDRYAITKFTINHSGYYAITDSLISKTESAGDGIELIVHNDAGEQYFRTVVSPLGTVNFDLPLGYLGKGESVYVAIGADGSHESDWFSLDFNIVAEPMVRPDPLRELDTQITINVRDYGALPNDDLRDDVSIQNAIDDAIRIQKLHAVPVLLQLEAGTYRLGKFDGMNLRMAGATEIHVAGAGVERTTLLVTRAKSGMMRITDSHDVLFSDFSVDYEQLPHSQGRVVDVLSPTRVILLADPGYAAPDDPALFNDNLVTHRTQFLHSDRTGRLINNSDFYNSIKPQTVRNPNGTYTVTYQYPVPENLKRGDAWYQIARQSSRGIFGLARNTGHTSFTRINAYASASGFVQGQNNELIDVIDTQVKLKDGRLVSMPSDLVHVQRSKFGPWVENNVFRGPADDLIHVYRFLESDLGVQVAPNQFHIINGKDLHSGDEILFVRDGGYRRTARIDSLDGNVLTTNQPIDGYTNSTTIIPMQYDSSGGVIRDNVFGLHRAGQGSVVVFAPDTTILGNRFKGINSHAIAAIGYEDFSISDSMVVEGNKFRDIGFKAALPPIELDPHIQNLTIIDNFFANTFGQQSIGPSFSQSMHADSAGDNNESDSFPAPPPFQDLGRELQDEFANELATEFDHEFWRGISFH